MIGGKSYIKLWDRFSFADFVLCLYILCPAITSLLNGDPIQVGTSTIPGVGIYDGLAAVFSQLVALIPYFLGRQFVRNARSSEEILRVLAVAGISYSLLLLFEIRLSPQLHLWFYGYYPSDFIQEIREGGSFRPMVFMGHGLIASFFTMTTVVACAALWRTKSPLFGLNAGPITAYLAAVLYLCKSGAALVYGLVLTPLVRWASPAFQVRIAMILAIFALLYPLMRIGEVFPTRALTDISESIDEARAGSLLFRFDQEERLLDHAVQRPLFGWGRFGRNRVFTEDWQGAGADISVTDGRWIITFGQFGIFGFLAEFGLLAIPIFRAANAIKLLGPSRESAFLAALALIIAINLIDLLPNSTLSPWTWLLAGSLWGSSQTTRLRARMKSRQPTTRALDRLVSARL